MNSQGDIEKNVKQVLRRLDQAVQRENQDSHAQVDLPENSSSQSINRWLPDSLFGIGMGFVMLFTAMLVIVVPQPEYKVMFGFFATICLLVCAYKLDKVSQRLRKTNDNNRKPN